MFVVYVLFAGCCCWLFVVDGCLLLFVVCWLLCVVRCVPSVVCCLAFDACLSFVV